MDAVHKSCLRPCGAESCDLCKESVMGQGRERGREREREKLTNRKKERKNDTQDIDFKGRHTYIYIYTCKEYYKHVQVRT